MSKSCQKQGTPKLFFCIDSKNQPSKSVKKGSAMLEAEPERETSVPIGILSLLKCYEGFFDGDEVW